MTKTSMSASVFSFTGFVRYFAGFFYRAYFYFSGGKKITG